MQFVSCRLMKHLADRQADRALEKEGGGREGKRRGGDEMR